MQAGPPTAPFVRAAGLLAVAAAFVAWALHLWLRPGAEPVEAVHLVEYGILGVLAARALRHHAADSGSLLAAGLLVALVGTLDEVIQWLVPNRFFDLRDVVINAGSGALVQIALGWLRLRRSRCRGRRPAPGLPTGRGGAASARCACSTRRREWRRTAPRCQVSPSCPTVLTPWPSTGTSW
jgi:hypothetical protein